MTQRLLDLRLPGFVQWGQSFDVREVPGTGLESLRLRYGADAQDLRGRLEPFELQPVKPAAPEPATPAQDGEGPGFDQAAQESESPAAATPTAAPPAPSLPAPAATTQP